MGGQTEYPLSGIIRHHRPIAAPISVIIFHQNTGHVTDSPPAQGHVISLMMFCEDSAGNTGSAYLNLLVNTPPAGGDLQVSPGNGAPNPFDLKPVDPKPVHPKPETCPPETPNPKP